MLRTRFSFVHANLQRVAQLVRAVKERKQHVVDAEKFLTRTEASLQGMHRELQAVHDELQEKEDFNLAPRVRKVKNELEEIAQSLAVQRTGTLETVLMLMSLRADEGAALAIKQGVERKLREIEPSCKLFQEKIDGPDHGEAWLAFHQLNEKAQDIFSEYVDLLGGLSLRDIGFDEGGCKLADELFRFYSLGRKE